jgi:hypothetical protein
MASARLSGLFDAREPDFLLLLRLLSSVLGFSTEQSAWGLCCVDLLAGSRCERFCWFLLEVERAGAAFAPEHWLSCAKVALGCVIHLSRDSDENARAFAMAAEVLRIVLAVPGRTRRAAPARRSRQSLRR